jgi:hypothetical protein
VAERAETDNLLMRRRIPSIFVVVLLLGALLSVAGSSRGASDAAVAYAPVVGMASTPDGAGYWLVGSDGGVFSYGDAGFYGSANRSALPTPAIGIAATSGGTGYWLLTANGGIATYGDALFFGAQRKTIALYGDSLGM